MEQFEQAVSYMTENFGRFLGVVNEVGDDLIKQENGIKNAILVTEKMLLDLLAYSPQYQKTSKCLIMQTN